MHKRPLFANFCLALAASPTFFRGALVLLLIQFFLLADNYSVLSASYWLGVVLIISLFLTCQWYLKYSSIPGFFENFLACWSFGGLGMLLGHRVEAVMTGHHSMVMHHITPVSLITSGMTLGMLIFCMPACIIFCKDKLTCLSKVEKLVLHFGNTLFMLLGMIFSIIISSHFFPEIYRNLFYHHFFMLLLMAAFSSLAYACVLLYFGKGKFNAIC